MKKKQNEKWYSQKQGSGGINAFNTSRCHKAF